MKLLIVALLLMTTTAEAGTARWANISCSEFIHTRDHKTFTWFHQDDTRTKCKTYAKREDGRVLICDDGSTPMMRIIDGGHIVFNRVEMWDPSDDRNGICD